MKLPNFTIAGFPKCGSTSLYYYLNEHPDIFLPKQKELHYFTYEILQHINCGKKDKEVHKFHIKTLEDYKAQFQAVENQKAVGDVSPSYANYAKSLSNLKKVLGAEVKMIVVLRDPIKRAYSNYLHLVREEREDKTFYEALKLEDERKAQGYSDFWYYKFNSLYFEKIERLKKEFKNVYIITFEEFVANPEKGMKDLYNFLEVDDTFVPQNLDVKYNPGGVYKKNVITKFFFRQSKLKSFLKKITPMNSELKSLKISIINKYKKGTPPIDKKSEELLIEYFKTDVQKLKSSFGVKTELWNKQFQN